MPKKRTVRQREAQRRVQAAQQRLARDEQEREEHVRVVAERSGDPRYTQRVPLPNGGVGLDWSTDTPEGRMLQEALEANQRAFREKFGRDPRPDDPVFFDPDAKQPTPLGADGWQSGFDALQQAAEDAGVDPAYLAAWQEVGYVVTDENRHLFSAADVQAYLDAVGRHQQPPPGPPLPANLFAVELTVTQRRAWCVEPDEELETWDVSADADDDDGGDVVSHVGDMRFVAVDVIEPGNPYKLLDGENENLSRIAKVIFNQKTGELADDLDDLLEVFGSRLLIIDQVQLEPQWRGFGIGALLTASAINMLSGGARAVICYPDPHENLDAAAQDRSRSTSRKKAIGALGVVCSRIGFEPFRDGVWVLDLNLVTFQNRRAQLMAEAQRYDHG